jgi:hypothetical protein
MTAVYDKPKAAAVDIKRSYYIHNEKDLYIDKEEPGQSS